MVYYEIQRRLQKPVIQRKKWRDDQELGQTQEWPGLTPLSEGQRVEITCLFIDIPRCTTVLRKRQRKPRGWILKVKFSIIIWETESEGLSHFPHHHPTERSKPEIQLEPIHSSGNPVITAFLTFLNFKRNLQINTKGQGKKKLTKWSILPYC